MSLESNGYEYAGCGTSIVVERQSDTVNRAYSNKFSRVAHRPVESRLMMVGIGVRLPNGVYVCGTCCGFCFEAGIPFCED